MEELGRLVREKRGVQGVREAARQADVSPATLSRVETGKTPDLETFKKLCVWLCVDPNELLGTTKSKTPKSPSNAMEFGDSMGQVFAHFRAKKTMSQDTVGHLAELIQAINKEL